MGVKWLYAGTLLVFAVGCTPRHDAAQSGSCEEAAAAGLASAEPDPVIMHLQTRNHDVIVHSGGHGLRFTVAMGDRVLFEGMEESEFAKNFPGLHQHFETAFADENSGAWAGL